MAGKLLPELDSLAILYTEGYEANVALADAVERALARAERRVVRLPVPSGNCRTDSDFDTALDALPKAPSRTLLYNPDDPNCSRFGNVICRLAAERRIVTLGSEATVGKGCAGALTLDSEALGKECADWMRGRDKASTTLDIRRAPYRVVLDVSRHE